MNLNENIYTLTEPHTSGDFLHTLAKECSFRGIELKQRIPHQIVLRIFGENGSFLLVLHATFKGVKIATSPGFKDELVKVEEFYTRHHIKPSLADELNHTLKVKQTQTLI